ncbi:GGDEF domain-containing protein [candidate division WOR-3 bacterium]|nr:GGDEF domain-containing protein [candidate division WOR-3 bacterium]
MRARQILKIISFLPFGVYVYFSLAGKLLYELNPLFLIAGPVLAAVGLMVTRNLWLFALAVAASNAAVQLTGGVSSQLFFFYFLLLFVEGLRTSTWRYFAAAGAVLVLETGSALFHLGENAFPFGNLAAFAAFTAILYLFLRREQKRSTALAKDLEKERAKYYWIDPLTAPRSERLNALREERYSLDADVLYKRFVEFTFASLEVDTVALFLICGKDVLQLVAICSKSEKASEDVTLAMGEGLVGYLAREGKPALLTDLGADSGRLGYYAGEVEVSSLATAPVQREETNYGILVADARRRLTSYEQGFLIQVAALIAGDIELAAAYEERHREAMRFSGLYELAGNLLVGVSRDELIDRSFELVRELFAPDAIGFARLKQGEGAEVLRYEGGEDFANGFRFEAERSLVAMAAKHKGFLKQRDMSKPGLYRLGPGEKAPSNCTFFGIGFGEDAATQGVLWLEKEQVDAYSEREGKILGFAATLLSAAFLRVRYQEELARLARLDGLTGLLNHRTFQEELEKHMKESATLALFIIDLDLFKKVNDTYGHPVGDMVLAKVAEVIKDKGIAARYGGEEFALIVPNITSQQILGRGEEVLAGIRRAEVKIREGTIKFTASVGAAFYPTDFKTREDLIRAADAALYQAKTGGRDRLALAGKDILESR